MTPDLTKIQTVSYAAFLQDETSRRTNARTRGWKACCARSSRSKATTSRSSLEYLRYELGKPRYTPDECRQLRLTYGQPFRVCCG